MHILIVDDTKSTVLLLKEFLTHKKYRVSYVEDGLAAVELCKQELPDLILMDIVMPKMDGIEATKLIKALAGDRVIPILIMSGLTEAVSIVDAFNAGADDYLTKPVIPEVLDVRIRTIQRNFTTQQSLHMILDNVYEAIISIDSKGHIRNFNKAAERIFEYTPSEVIGQNVKMLMPPPYADEHDGYLGRYMKERTPHVIGIGRKVHGLRKSGEVFPMKLAVTEVKRNIGNLYIGLVSDISEEEAAKRKIEFLAFHGTLTSVPNRAHFNATFEAMLKEQASGKHALCFIDLDGFKQVNDTMGHDAGDEVLVTVANRLKNCLSEQDFFARLGGDEFVVITYDVKDSKNAMSIAERVLASIAKPMNIMGSNKTIGASIGIAMIPQHGKALSEVLSAADNAMYEAKRSGKNQCVMAK